MERTMGRLCLILVGLLVAPPAHGAAQKVPPSSSPAPSPVVADEVPVRMEDLLRQTPGAVPVTVILAIEAQGQKEGERGGHRNLGAPGRDAAALAAAAAKAFEKWLTPRELFSYRGSAQLGSPNSFELAEQKFTVTLVPSRDTESFRLSLAIARPDGVPLPADWGEVSEPATGASRRAHAFRFLAGGNAYYLIVDLDLAGFPR